MKNYKILVDGFSVDTFQSSKKLTDNERRNIAYAWAKDHDISAAGVQVL